MAECEAVERDGDGDGGRGAVRVSGWNEGASVLPVPCLLHSPPLRPMIHSSLRPTRPRSSTLLLAASLAAFSTPCTRLPFVLPCLDTRSRRPWSGLRSTHCTLMQGSMHSHAHAYAYAYLLQTPTSLAPRGCQHGVTALEHRVISQTSRSLREITTDPGNLIGPSCMNDGELWSSVAALEQATGKP